LETPVPIPNTEVKLPTLMAVVADKLRTHQAVFLYFYKILILGEIMKKLDRIYILGTCGSGKSFLGELLSQKLNLPFYDSDDIMFVKKFTKSRSKRKRKELMDKIAKRKKWIIDARGSDWSIDPMKKSDLIIWLQTHFIKRSWRILKRYFNRKGTFEENLKENLKTIRYSLSYERTQGSSKYDSHLKFIEKNKLKPIIIKNSRQLKQFLKEVKK
jgi:adenylate kinase family enzyme